jgi:hypothetical protein
MDGRLIFRHHPGRLSLSGRRDRGGQPARWLSRKGEDVYDSEAPDVTDEKSRQGTTGMPVLKPTQVGAMKIPRRSGERW